MSPDRIESPVALVSPSHIIPSSSRASSLRLRSASDSSRRYAARRRAWRESTGWSMEAARAWRAAREPRMPPF